MHHRAACACSLGQPALLPSLAAPADLQRSLAAVVRKAPWGTKGQNKNDRQRLFNKRKKLLNK